MNSLRRIIFQTRTLTALLLSMSALYMSADITDLPTKSVNGRTYYYYKVKPKETIYSLSRELKVSKNDIFKYNPSAADGLKAGQELIFPVDAKASYTPATGDPSAPLTHTVVRGETLFGISGRYHITTDQIKTWNPSVAEGLKAGMVIYVSDPSKAPAIEERQIPDGKRYVIKRGETLYQIAHDNNTTVDEIIALNPGLDRIHYSAGQTISLPAGSKFTTQEEPVRNIAGTKTYVVSDGETLYSIARANNITVEQLEKANPGLGVIKKGMTLTLPETVTVTENVISNTVDNDFHAATDSSETQQSIVLPSPDYTISSIDLLQNTPVKIAVALPFMASAEDKPKSAQLFTEFYRGFMLAVDSVRNSGRPVYVYAYDTAENLDSVRRILSRPEMKEMSLIIAPDDEVQLREFAFFGRTNTIPVINTFVVKDNSFRYNPSIIQCNIPHRDMYSKAVKEMTREFIGATPVILNSQNGPDDKAEYIQHLRQQLDSMDVRYITIDYTGRLTQNDLSALKAGHKYVFIPTSGKQSEFAKIAPALLDLKEKSIDSNDVRVFGYPEWVTFKGESLKQLHELNASIYSRFYSDPNGKRVSEIETKYKNWFGNDMGNFIPSQGLLGFDLGMFVIDMLRTPSVMVDNPASDAFSSPVKIYDGVQNGYHIIRLPNAGYMNDLLYIVTFRPSGIIERRSI